MAISDRTRKILWGRSAALCAFCRRTLVEEGTKLNAESVVGDECHIVGEKPSAARGAQGVGKDDLDDYPNLILLCKVHHKLFDDQFREFTIEKLTAMKLAHENWVKETITKRSNPVSTPKFVLLVRLKTGSEVAGAVGGAYAFEFSNDEPETEAEAEQIGGFLQNVQDWADLWDDMEASSQGKAKFSINQEVKELEAAGFLVFGAKLQRRLISGGQIFDWPIATIAVVRSTNKGISELGDLATILTN